MRRIIRPVGHVCEFSGVGERFRHAPWGIFGGASGRPGRFLIRCSDSSCNVLPTKISGLKLNPDEAIIVETPGAGGYGPPAERAAEAIARDRSSGKFSDEYLAQNYGCEPRERIKTASSLQPQSDREEK